MSADLPAVLVAFGRRVRQLRQAQHQTLAEVAALTGWTVEHLTEVEAGTVEADVQGVFLLSTALDVRPGDLFTD